MYGCMHVCVCEGVVNEEYNMFMIFEVLCIHFLCSCTALCVHLSHVHLSHVHLSQSDIGQQK